MKKNNFYYRNLPHWQPSEAEFFVTFRLKNSIPTSVIRQIEEKWKSISKTEVGMANYEIRKQRQIFSQYEKILDRGNRGPTWLAEPKVADIVVEALHHRDKVKYDLYAFCIMANHVHVVFRLLKEGETDFPVTKIFKNLKSYTALKANKMLNRTGPFWQSESYDRVIRDQDELGNTIKYVLNNPVKAELVNHWEDWEFTYCKDEFLS